MTGEDRHSNGERLTRWLNESRRGTKDVFGRPCGSDSWQSWLIAIARVSERDLNGLAREAVPLEQGVLVLVGDRTLIKKQLEGLDLPEPVELSASGNAVAD